MNSPLTKAERLLLSAQFRVLARLTGAPEYERDAKIIESGYVSLHQELLTAIEDEVSADKTLLVMNVLEMYADIYSATKGMPPLPLTFSGFCDPPEGDEFYFASFVIEELGRHTVLGTIPQAKSPMMPKYLRMLACYKQREDIFELSQRDLLRLASVAELVIDDDKDNRLVN